MMTGWLTPLTFINYDILGKNLTGKLVRQKFSRKMLYRTAINTHVYCAKIYTKHETYGFCFIIT